MENKRLDFLDGLRGVAALAVLLHHAARVPQYKMPLPVWAKDFVDFGSAGVTLFFVISAFSLCLTMPRHLSSRRPLLSFYASRFFRIAPLFYFVIVLSVIRAIIVWNYLIPMPQILSSFSFLYNFIPGWQESIVWAGWTVGVEMVFYVAFPILYFRIGSLASLAIITAAAITVAALFPLLLAAWMPAAEAAKFRDFSIVRHLPTFLIGMGAYFAYRKLSQRPHQGLAIALTLVGIAGIVAMMTGYGKFFRGDHNYWQALFFSCVLVGSSLTSARLFAIALISDAGRISYSVYLLHAPITWHLGPIYDRIYRTIGSVDVAFSLCIILTLLIVIPLAMLSYRYIEKPGVELGKRFIAQFTADDRLSRSPFPERLSA